LKAPERQGPWAATVGGWLDHSRTQDLPPEAERAAITATFDTLACALGALEHEAAIGMRKVVEALGGTAEASLIGPGPEITSRPDQSRTMTSASNAILLNGTLIRALDCNDGFLGEGGVGGHPSDNIAVALAFAEATHAAGREYLRAVAVGYELYWRLRHYVFMPGRGYRWDHVSTSGMVSAAIAGLLLGLGPERLGNAVSIGGAQTYSLGEIRAGEISMLKASANAVTAHGGALAALMAREGMTGPDLVFEGKRGLLAALGLSPSDELFDLLTAPIDRWHICDVAMKAYPAVGTSQGAIAATLGLIAQHQLSPADIDSIDVRVPDSPVLRNHISDDSRARPRSRGTADHSFPFLIAVAVEDGDVGLSQFSGDRWLRPSTLALMDKIRLDTDTRLNGHAKNGVPAAVEIRTRSQTLSSGIVGAPGTLENPFTDEQLKQKMRRLAPAFVPTQRLEKIYTHVFELPSLDDVARLSPVLIGA